MFGWENVLRDPEYVRVPVRDASGLADEVVRQLAAGRNIPIRDAPGVPKLRYPRAPQSYEGIVELLRQQPNGAPDPLVRILAIRQTLTVPRLGARLAVPHGVREPVDVEKAVFAASFICAPDENHQALFATVTIDWSKVGRRDQAVLDLDERWIHGDDVTAVQGELEQVFMAADRQYHASGHPSGRALRRVVLFGGRGAGDEGWQLHARAAARARDLDLVIIERPSDLREPALRSALNDGRPLAHVLWTPHLGHAGMTDRIVALAGETPIIRLDDPLFASALPMLRDSLDSLPANEAVEDFVVAEAAPAPGEVRYYKKVFPHPQRDVVVQVRVRPTCAWTPVHGGAPKARKGIAHRAGREPDRLWHCDRCEGGGHWQAEF